MTSHPAVVDTVQQELDDFVRNSPGNVVAELDLMRMYAQPLLAVADANDALWEILKHADVVGPQHLSPTEWFEGARSVISCFLPFTERVRVANRPMGWPATEWLYGRHEGAAFVDAACSFLIRAVQQLGGHALAPSLDGRFALVDLRSNWSERHVAFIAGLGTVSLNRSLITESGSAGRLTSVITDLVLEATPRPYREVDEYCTKCGACLRRCPPQAIDESGKDNGVCAQYLKETKLRYQPRYGCGKCQTGVPCEAGKPLTAKPEAGIEMARR